MNTSGNFNNSPPGPMLSYPFPIQNRAQHPSLMEQQSYVAPIAQQFQPYPTAPAPTYNPRPMMHTPKSEKRKQEILNCDVCGIEVNSQQMMDAHLQGQKHIKKMKLKIGTTANQSTNTSSENIDLNSTSTPLVTATNNEISTPTTESNPVPPIVTKTTSSNEKSVLQTINELAKFNRVNVKYDLIKETGPAHCKQFEVRLTLAEETYIGNGTSIKRAQQDAAEKALSLTTLKKAESTPRVSHTPRPVRGTATRGLHTNIRSNFSTQPIRAKPLPTPIVQANENSFQNFLNNKGAETVEDDNRITMIHQLVDEIERTLKVVSDKITEQCKQKNTPVVPQLPDNVKLNNIEQPNEDPTESFRMLKGAMKVSTLAMRLFVKYECEHSLVLICANKPTESLLKDICQELIIGLNAQGIAALQLESNNEQSTPINYQVRINVDDASLTVQCSRLPKYSIRIRLTSPVFRSENFLNWDDQTREQIAQLNPDPSDMLDKNKCLEAAAEIRHSNWFTHNMSENPSNIIVLRLLRDLQYYQTPLSSLNLWCIVLLVYKCQVQPIKSVLALFRSVFSCLSSGILLANNLGPGIIDPCEKDLVDAASYLTNEQRLDITKYAHDTLRLIAFDKYENIFQTPTIQSEQLTVNSTPASYQMD